jgi:hypothetical protein
MVPPRLWPRLRASGERWITLLLYGTLAATAWFLISLVFNHKIDAVTELFLEPPPALTLVLFIFFFAFALWQHRKRIPAWLGLNRRFLTYPPLWVAVPIGCVAAAIVNSYHCLCPELDRLRLEVLNIPYWGAGLVIAYGVTLVIVSVVMLRNSHVRDHFSLSIEAAHNAKYPSPIDSWNFDRILDWLQDDREIDRPDLDYFGHDNVARRIAFRLCQDGNTHRPTMAVVGVRGSGKSSIAKLVKHHLKGHPDVRLVPLSLWPFDCARAAVRGILDALIKELSNHVNVLSIAGLPDQYAAAIEAAPSPWRGLFALLRTKSDPEQILQRISHITAATGLHLVLWIDDLDRFATHSVEPTERSAELVAPVYALLHLLDRADGISVIIATPTLGPHFDIHKLVRFIEHPPLIEYAHARQVVGTFRNGCRTTKIGDRDLIDSVPEHFRKEFDFLGQEHCDSAFFRTGKPPPPRQAVTDLLATPRNLKTALRLVYETWKTLPGEIDFDDILCISTIRVVRPDIVAFIDKHIDLMREGPGQPSGQGPEDNHPLYTEFRTHVDDRAPDGRAVISLVNHLFPKVLGSRFYDLLGKHPPNDPKTVHIWRPQGLAVKRHADYWRRYLATPKLADDERDQPVLRDIENWKTKVDNALIDRLIDPVRCAKVESFVCRIDLDDLERLVQDVVDALQAHPSEIWDETNRASGLTALRRMIEEKFMVYDAEDRKKRLLAPLARLVQTNLPVAFEIIYQFVDSSPVDNRIPPLWQQRDPIREEVNALIADTYPLGSETRLVSALRNAHPCVLFWLCWGVERIRQNKTADVPFAKWKDFAAVLLAAAHLDNRAIVGQIIPFVTTHGGVTWLPCDKKPEPSKTAAPPEFDASAAKCLFNEEYDRLLELLANTPCPPLDNDEFRRRFAAAQTACKQILADRESAIT